MLEVQTARRILPHIHARHYRQPRAYALDVHRLTAKDVARFALLDEAIAEVRAQLQSVVAVEAGKGKLPLLIELPVIAHHRENRVRNVTLAVVNRVALHRYLNRNQSRNVREPVIPNSVQRQIMLPQV